MAGSGGTQPWRQRRDCRVTLSTCNGNEDTNSKYTESGLQWGISASILFSAWVSKRSLWQSTVCYWVCKQTTLTVYCSFKKYGVDPDLYWKHLQKYEDMEYLKIGGLWGFEDDTKKRILFVNWKGVWRPSCPAGVCIIHLWSNPWSERKTLFGFRFFCFQSQRQERQQKQRQQWQRRQCMIKKNLDLSRKPCADSIFVVLWSEGQTKGETFDIWHFLQNNA